MLEITEEELKNGWTEKTLSIYVKEREKSQSSAIDITNRKRKPEQQTTYKPLRWRE